MNRKIYNFELGQIQAPAVFNDRGVAGSWPYMGGTDPKLGQRLNVHCDDSIIYLCKDPWTAQIRSTFHTITGSRCFVSKLLTTSRGDLCNKTNYVRRKQTRLEGVGDDGEAKAMGWDRRKQSLWGKYVCQFEYRHYVLSNTFKII